MNKKEQKIKRRRRSWYYMKSYYIYVRHDMIMEEKHFEVKCGQYGADISIKMSGNDELWMAKMKKKSFAYHFMGKITIQLMECAIKS